MYLELKKVQDFFQTHLRPIMRAAKKSEISLNVLATGYHDQSLNLTTSSSGPISEATEISLNFYASKDNELVCLKIPVFLDQAPDKDIVLTSIEELFKSGHSSAPLREEEDVHVIKSHEDIVDEKLLTIDLDELITFFRSRFLIDSPKKLLYSSSISRGFTFQAYVDSESGIQFSASSYYSVKCDLRTQLSQFHYENSGRTLRELRLSPIRKHLGAFWKAKPMEYELRDFTGTIIIGFQALGKISEAGLIAMKNNNDSLWHWIKKVGEVNEEYSTGLSCNQSEVTGTIAKDIDETFSSWIFPSGSEEMPLGELLMGESNKSDHAIYFHDLTVSIHKDRIRMISNSTSLYINKNREPNILDIVFETKLTGEIIANAHASNSLMPIMRSGGRKSLLVPEYICLYDQPVKIISISKSDT